MPKTKNLISRRYWKSLIYGQLHKKDYTSLQNYCMFIGYQRSGHSYIGALLDAHPNASVGMEVDALNLVGLGYSRNQVYFCLTNNARIFTRVLKNVWTGYSYAVPGSSQGRYDKLLTIGDKKGGKSTLRLGENPELLKKLQTLTNLPVKIIHVIRNPYDNISTMLIRYAEKGNEINRSVFENKIDLYFKKVAINDSLRKKSGFSILDVYHEDFIASPKTNLERIIKFIGLQDVDNYLEKCSQTTYKSPNKSRHKIDWPEELKELVYARLSQCEFLKHYTFDD